MTEFDLREYHTVVLGALLHDIGKFYQRALEKGKGNHQQLGLECFEEFFVKGISKIFSQTEIDKIKSAINNHHEYEEFITVADALSAGMDRVELADYEIGDISKERLQSIFQKISLGNHVPTVEYRYNLRPLSLKKEDIFPKEFTENNILTSEYNNLWKNFVIELKSLPHSSSTLYLNSLYHLLWKYTWCIPSAVYKSEPDISLFDHLKTTAAIAGCLYVFKQSKDRSEKEFLIFSGDISGIQSFIYKITSVQGVGGISKRLRGRSFYLTLLQEVIATYILRKLSLSIPHLLLCGGGRFEILLPNTASLKNDLAEMSKKINRWLIDEYSGELGLVTTFIEVDQYSIMEYSEVLKELDYKLSKTKKNKYKEFFTESNFWVENNKADKLVRVCRSCNITLVEKGINNEICALCEKHKYIGEKLPKSQYIAFLPEPSKELKEFPIQFGEYGTVYLLLKLNDTVKKLPNLYSINEITGNFKLIGNTAPIAISDFQQETEEEQNGQKFAQKGNVLTFETVADMSIGDKKLGILKMDVDYLGLIFSIGFKEGEKSISRVTSLSRSLDWFFTGYINEICKSVFEDWKRKAYKAGWGDKADKIENIFYIVYSGGDDLLIIGPWSEIPTLAQKIRDEFKEYTCSNTDINLSAGIFICKPKFPISIAAKSAGKELDCSKDNGRDRITFFGDTIKWDENETSCGFKEILDFGEFLYERISTENSDNKLSRSFAHGLLKKHRQYQGGQDYNFIPSVIYQLYRNVKNEHLRKQLKAKLITDKKGYFKHIKIPASYALLKSRKEE